MFDTTGDHRQNPDSNIEHKYDYLKIIP